MKKRGEPRLIKPKPFEIVELKFDILGEVPKDWLHDGKYGLSIGWLSENGNYLPMSGPSAEIIPSFLSNLKNRVKFYSHINLYSKDPEHPHGIIIEINGSSEELFHLFPFILRGTNRAYDGKVDELRERLLNAVERVKRLKDEWKDYRREQEKRSRQTVWDKKMSQDIFKILDQADESFAPFTESEEDKNEQEFTEKYREVVRWQGPMLGGRVGDMGGYDFRVYSTDHAPQHFHIIHKGRGIDARFSYPAIELVDYTDQHSNIIGTKEIGKIKAYYQVPENLKKLEKEFEKQILT